MAEKLKRKTFPVGHGPSDFECFGPPALEDGNFDNVMIADMGCFQQNEVDSNKYYHGAVVRSKIDDTYFAYFEYGRTGGTPDFIFTQCVSKSEAQSVFEKQMLSKNVKRGEWITIAGRKSLVAKKKKNGTLCDCYLVRPAAKRTIGLPDAASIIHDDTANTKVVTTTKKSTKKNNSNIDKQTLDLMRAMNMAAIDYTRASISGGHIPTQSAIDEGRDILLEATKQVGQVGNNVQDQVSDRKLKELTSLMYGRIPKVKLLRAPEKDWILSQDNIQTWNLDLDAFESALAAIQIDEYQDTGSPLDGMNIDMVWMPTSTREGAFLNEWMPSASANKHRGVGKMKILNMWVVRQKSFLSRFDQKVQSLSGILPSTFERPKFQPKVRTDIEASLQKTYRSANVNPLFHGTRSVNVPGILREGLRLPKHLVGVAIQGAMFGPGTYWADDWRKSHGYTSSPGTRYSSGEGGVKGRGAFILVADVALGRPFVADGWSGYTKAPNGYHSVAGLAHKSGVYNNEWIVYDVAQNDLRYLVEYETRR